MIGIVTVLYNSAQVLDDFFKSLSQQTMRDFKLYIVDNASPDNSLEVAKQLSKEAMFGVKIIENSQNFGVAKGNNQGSSAALDDGCDYVLFSNNDVVLRDDTIEQLLAGMAAMNAWIAVPKIYFAHDNQLIWFGGGKFNRFLARTPHFGYGEKDSGAFDLQSWTEYAPTCFMLCRRELFSKVGMMDEAYFVYYDDSDFVYRALNLGYRIAYVPSSMLEHKESVSTGKKSLFSLYYTSRNVVYFTRKNLPASYSIPVYGYKLMVFVLCLFKYKRKELKAVLKGYRDGFKLAVNKPHS